MKRLVLCCAVSIGSIVVASAPARAAEPGPWKLSTTALLSLSQSTFSTNWSGGDHGAIVWVLGTDTQAEKQVGARFNWTNHLELAFGQTAQQNPDPGQGGKLVWDSPEKSSDKIAFESIGRWTLGGLVDPYVSLGLNSQFLDQSNPLGTLDLNPVKLKEAAGVARVLMKTADAEAITRLGVGVRQTFGRTFVLDPTLRKVSFTANDGGVEWKTTVTQPLAEKKILYKGSLLLFKPVLYSKSEDLKHYDERVLAGEGTVPPDPTREAVADFWKEVDLNFQNEFTASITKVIGVSLTAQLVYDKFDTAANVDNTLPLSALEPEIQRNTRKAGQFREVLAVALKYRLF